MKNNAPLFSYTEYLTLPDKEEVEITAETFSNPIFDKGDPVFSQIKVIRVKSKSVNKVIYSTEQLQTPELQKEVKQFKEQASKYKTISELISAV